MYVAINVRDGDGVIIEIRDRRGDIFGILASSQEEMRAGGNVG